MSAVTGRDDLATVTTLGVAGAALGVLAGVVEASVGAHLRDWIGGKSSPFPLGLTTIALSVVALAAALLARRAPARASARLGIAVALLLPAGVGFSTIGRLWYLPGALLLVAGGLALRAAHCAGGLGAMVARDWGRILLGALGGIYAFLGILAWDAATVLALLGTAGVVATLRGVPSTARGRGAVIVLTAIPFAAVTWWSVVAPLVAVLIVAVGLPQVATRPRSVARTLTQQLP